MYCWIMWHPVRLWLRDGILLLMWAFGTPNDDTHGSDRYRRTSGGLDILAIGCRLAPVGLGVSIVEGPNAQVASGTLLHFGRLTAIHFNYCFHSLLSTLLANCFLIL